MTDTRVKNHMLHKFVISFFRFFAEPFIKHSNCFSYERVPAQNGNYIVCSNHVTVTDPILISLSFRPQMYFVASEHIMQKGIVSALLKWAVDPIVRLKSGSGVNTVKDMLSCLKNGYNVCIFPEGDCSFDGNTGPMLPTIGKLVKTCKRTLITYRFEGGYLQHPRWSAKRRKGPIRGHVVSTYTPEMLSGMTADEINKAIINDLDEHAYERQRREMNVYSSRAKAEALETLFYICPECGGIGGITSKGDSFSCTCGMSGSMDDHGFLHGIRFETLEEWDRWQTERLGELAHEADFSDDAVLYHVDKKHKRKRVCAGRVHMNAEAFSIGDIRFGLAEISDMDLIRSNYLVFIANGEHYELRGSEHFCSRKYMQLLRTLGSADA